MEVKLHELEMRNVYAQTLAELAIAIEHLVLDNIERMSDSDAAQMLQELQ